MKKVLVMLLVLFALTSQAYAGNNLRKETGTTKKEEQKIMQVLKETGFDMKIEEIKYDDMLDNMENKQEKGYRIKYSKSVNNVILYLLPDKTVDRIVWGDLHYSNGKVIKNAKENIVSINEINKYVPACERAIEQLLLAPSTAKFPNPLNWRFGKNKGILTIQSYVDSQNGFGAMVRTEFQFKIDTKTDTTLSIIFEGKELMPQSKKNKK